MKWFILIQYFFFNGCALLRELFSSCDEQGYSPVAVPRPLIAVASLVAENGLQGAQASAVMARGLSSFGSPAPEHRSKSCGAWAESLCGKWDLPRSRLKPVSPASAGRFFPTEPPEKPPHVGILKIRSLRLLIYAQMTMLRLFLLYLILPGVTF